MEHTKTCLLVLIALTSLLHSGMCESVGLGSALKYDTIVPVKMSEGMFDSWNKKDKNGPSLALNRFRRQAHLIVSSEIFNKLAGRRWAHRTTTPRPTLEVVEY